MTRYTCEQRTDTFGTYFWQVFDATLDEYTTFVAGFGSEEEAKAYAGIRNAGMKLVYQAEEARNIDCGHPESSWVFAEGLMGFCLTCADTH